MSAKSTIEWTDATWNPTSGCTKVGPGCLNCYAESIARRFPARYYPDGKYVPWTVKAQRESGQPAVMLHPDRLDWPLKQKKPMKIFVDSMSDLFHEDVPDDFIAHVFVTMMLARHHTFQVLTKRPDRMADLAPRLKALMRGVMYEAIKSYDNGGPEPWYFRRQGRHHGAPREFWIERWYNDYTEDDPNNPHLDWRNWPLRNVWIGVSVENQRYADERIPLLLETPAAVRFISAEPLLGPVDIGKWLHCDLCNYPLHPAEVVDTEPCEACGGIDQQPRLDWVIVGGESGPKARPMNPDWARSIRDQCRAAGVPFFFKQWGEWIPLDQKDAQGNYCLVPLNGQMDYVKLGKGKAGCHLDGFEHHSAQDDRNGPDAGADGGTKLIHDLRPGRPGNRRARSRAHHRSLVRP